MFCTHCGQQNLDAAQFCTRCGNSLTASARTAATLAVPVPPQRKRFEVSKLFMGMLYALLGLIIIGGVGVAVAGKSESTVMIKMIINWLLGIFFGVSVLGLMGGCIAGVILLIKAGQNQADGSYYRRNAIWCIVGPIVIIVSIILSYVIINVISGVINPVLK